jgi:hypothetical protein
MVNKPLILKIAATRVYLAQQVGGWERHLRELGGAFALKKKPFIEAGWGFSWRSAKSRLVQST